MTTVAGPLQLGLPWGDESLATADPASGVGQPAVSPPTLWGLTPAARMSPSTGSPVGTPSGRQDDLPGRAHPGGLTWFRHPHATHEVRLGEAMVAYEFKRARRRSIGMVVGVDGLSVRAPRWVSRADIEVALRAKERWICAKLVEQRERAHKQAVSRIEWREGAAVPYLGEPLVLVLDPRVSGAVLRESPATDPGLPGVAQRALHLGLPEQAGPEQIRDVVQAWLQREARRVFEPRVQHFAQALSVFVRRVSLSSAKTRWGSASADGSIRLHWRLIHFSHSIIDYVVAHELAHLREMNHSPRFWDVVRSVMPEFDGARHQLRHAVIPELD